MNNKPLQHISYFQNTHVVPETNIHFSTLRFLYTTYVGTIIRFFLRSKIIAFCVGFYNNNKISAKKIKPFIEQHAIDMHDFVIPHNGYATFNEFFTRTLKPEARPIDQSSWLVSPADSKLYVIPNISDNPYFFVKNTTFNLESFLGSTILAKQFEHGTLCIFRLAPYDYHRFHFPVDCTPSKPQAIKGKLESVNPITFHTNHQPLITNERQIVMLQTEHHGNIAMIAVGAMMVGKIFHTFSPDKPYKKGAEVGYFAFGGSTIVLVFEKNQLKINTIFIKNSLLGLETALKIGVSLL